MRSAVQSCVPLLENQALTKFSWVLFSLWGTPEFIQFSVISGSTESPGYFQSRPENRPYLAAHGKFPSPARKSCLFMAGTSTKHAAWHLKRYRQVDFWLNHWLTVQIMVLSTWFFRWSGFPTKGKDYLFKKVYCHIYFCRLNSSSDIKLQNFVD